tara:strand:- start:815 stop:2371 length:1557 start_codon:yes stop_codon:yes gene_type:complete
MADLSTKTLSDVKSGWLHSVVQSNGNITELKNDAIANVCDGNDNKSNLFLTKGKSVMIGNFTEADPPTNNSLFIKSIDDTVDTFVVNTQTTESSFQVKFKEDAGGNMIISDRVGSGNAGSNTFKIHSKGQSGLGHIYFATSNTSGSMSTGLVIKGQSYGSNVGINTINPSEKLHVVGNIKLSAGIVKQPIRVIHIDPVLGDNSQSGWVTGQAVQSLSYAMQLINGLTNTSIYLVLHGKDNSSSGNISDNLYNIVNDCVLTNCTLIIQGVTHDGNSLSDTDTELDYPRLGFTMDTSGTERRAYGFELTNCKVHVKHVRLVTPVYSSSVTDDPSGANDGLFKASQYGGFDIQFSHLRTELGDAPVVSGGLINTVNINMYRNRIIRTNSALTYGSVGQNGGQDNSGIASVPVWTSGTHFMNSVDTEGKDLGLFSDTHQGNIYVYGDTEVLSGGNAGMYGAFPSTDSSAYSYINPTTNDQGETERNLFGNVDAQYVATTDGSTTGKKPLNFNTNRFAGWYTP